MATMTKIDKRDIGRRLKLKRLEAKKERYEIAEALGVSLAAVGMYERGERIPKDEIKLKIAEYYGEDVQSLFY